MQTTRLRILLSPSRRQWRVSLGMELLVFIACFVATVLADGSGVTHQGSTIPYPPPPPKVQLPTFPAKVEASPMSPPEDETSTEKWQKRTPPPPPPPPRNIPAKTVEEEALSRLPAQNFIPPPPPRGFTNPVPETNQLASSHGAGNVSAEQVQTEEEEAVPREKKFQTKSSSASSLLSKDSQSFDAGKYSSKKDHIIKVEVMTLKDNNINWPDIKEMEPKKDMVSARLVDRTAMQAAPTSSTEMKAEYPLPNYTITSDDRMSRLSQPQDFHPRDQWSRKESLPQGLQGEHLSSATVSSPQNTIGDMRARRLAPAGKPDTTEPPEPPQQDLRPQTTGSRPYQDSFQRPQPLNAYHRPSNQGLPPQPRNRLQPQPAEASVISSTWKTLWGKVEKGLDSLAQVEDAVARHAQRLFSSSSSVASPPSQRRSAPSTDDMTTWDARERLARVSTPTNIPLTPYGNKYNVAMKQQRQPDISKSQQIKSAARSKGPINWSDMATGKMIRANGGASSPDGQQPLPPSNPSFAVQQNQVPPFDSTAGHSQHIERRSTQTGQYAANPYLQSSNLRTPLKEPPPVADPHSRSSRIPWASSTSSSSSKPRRTTSSTQELRWNPPSGVKSDYDSDRTTFWSKIWRILPRIPRLSSPLKMFRKSSYLDASIDAWRDDDDAEDTKRGGFFGLFRRKPPGGLITPVTRRSDIRSGDGLAPPLKCMMMRCDDGKSTSLLLASDKTSCRTIGKYQAFFDGICVLFVLIGIQQVEGLGNIALPISIEDLLMNTLPQIASLLKGAVYTWAPVFAGYAYLALYMKRTLLNSRVHNLANHIGATVEEESQYAQLYLRLAAAIRMDPSLPASLRQAAASQVRSLVSTSRLNSFVTMVLGSLIVMTVTFIGPFFSAVETCLSQLVMLDEWRSWPIAWKLLVSNIRRILASLGLVLEGLVARGAATFLENPLQFAFHLSIFVSALLITLVPSIEKRRKINGEKDEDEGVAFSSGESAQQFAKLGASSATRLTMLSDIGSIENALEHWRNNRASVTEDSSSVSVLPTIRRFAYTLLVAIIAMLPIVVSHIVGMTWERGIAHVGVQWNSIFDVSVVLVGLFIVASNAIQQVVDFSQHRSAVKSFLSLLSQTLEEVRESKRRQADIQFMASVSPTAGLVVKDLWAAHTTKRAWAVRGANFQCKNGEILVVLGDDGAGKTRMLTTIAESLIFPPRRSLTSNKVRGVVAIGGVESSKWDKGVLKRRLGVLLSDVRTVADAASLYSGWTMEEILEPIDGLRMPNSDRKLSSNGKASILLALKITGLYTTLIPKLPSKLSTILTANEEDLRPSSLRPRSQVLSPAEWSKLILAKVLAQTIYDNENAAASVDKVENCMVGSVLILDDPTVQFSEVEEAKVLKDLRQTGAATVFATNKWATGRFADHVVVVSDGAIVESGTHNELIARGPQQSLYAAKWHAMTMQ